MLIKSGRDTFKIIGLNRIAQEQSMTHFYVQLLHPYTGIKQDGVIIIFYGTRNSFMKSSYDIQDHFTQYLVQNLVEYLISLNTQPEDGLDKKYLNDIISVVNKLIAQNQKKNNCSVTSVDWQFDTNKKRIKEGIKLLKSWRGVHGGKKE